jgi:glutaredoxin
MKNLILLSFIFLASVVSAQQKDITVYEKKEGAKNIVMARNTGKVSYVVMLKIESSGMDVIPSMTVEAIVPAGHIMELASLQPRPGEAWSYGYEVSYMEYAAGITPAVPDADPPVSPPSPPKGENELEPPAISSLSDARVVLYTKPGCGRCAAVKKQLDDRKIQYLLVDISTSSPEVNNMWKKLRDSGFTGDSVTMPVVRVNGKYHYNIKDLNGFVAGIK